MSPKARRYTPKTLKRLFALSGNQCAFPGCGKKLVNRNNAKDSNICHIEAASEGGERYNPDMTDEERADYKNLILLCIQHHDETNNVEKYPVQIMHQMKKEHESLQLHNQIQKKPRMLARLINAIAEIDLETLRTKEKLSSFNPQDKITFNSVKRYAPIIHEYKVFHQKLNSLYDELEVDGSFKKGKILANINILYLKSKGKLIDCSLDEAQQRQALRGASDDIIDEVYEQLLDKLEETELWEDDIVIGLHLVIVDAFMRCKILEEPI